MIKRHCDICDALLPTEELEIEVKGVKYSVMPSRYLTEEETGGLTALQGGSAKADLCPACVHYIAEKVMKIWNEDRDEGAILNGNATEGGVQ